MKKLIIALIIALACAGCDDSESKPKVSCPDCKVQQFERPATPLEKEILKTDKLKKTRVTMPDGTVTEPNW